MSSGLIGPLRYEKYSDRLKKQAHIHPTTLADCISHLPELCRMESIDGWTYHVDEGLGNLTSPAYGILIRLSPHWYVTVESCNGY